MPERNLFVGLNLFLLLLVSLCVQAQPTPKTGPPKPFLPLSPYVKPHHDPGLSIANLTPAQRSDLIARLYQADQRYRIALSSEKRPTPDQKQHLWRLIHANDKANAAILLNLIKTYGWPRNRTPADSTEIKAYVIVWHVSEYDRYRRFEPYLPEGLKHQRLVYPPLSLAEKWKGWK